MYEHSTIFEAHVTAVTAQLSSAQCSYKGTKSSLLDCEIPDVRIELGLRAV